MAKSVLYGKCGFREAEEFVMREIPNCGITCELSDWNYHNIGDVRVSVMVFEKYFMRSSNYASLTIVLSGREGDIRADLIGAGGRQGVLSFSWGTEDSFVRSAEETLRNIGFQ